MTRNLEVECLVLHCRSLVEDEAVDVNLRDTWDGVPLYYACLAGKLCTGVPDVPSGISCAYIL